jgi:hypothetical protein
MLLMRLAAFLDYAALHVAGWGLFTRMQPGHPCGSAPWRTGSMWHSWNDIAPQFSVSGSSAEAQAAKSGRRSAQGLARRISHWGLRKLVRSSRFALESMRGHP